MTQATEAHSLLIKMRDGLKQIGYDNDLLLPDYAFSDVLGDHDGAQTIPLAAFGQEPTSYKTACLGVSLTTSDDPREIEYCRALGAPLVLAIRPRTSTCRVWKMVAQGTPELREQFSTDTLIREITKRQDRWRPGEVLRAKNISFPQVSGQLDLYDAGLVPAIEAVVHRKLNELLSIVVAQAKSAYQERHDQEPDYRLLFQIIFRFIAAKLLGDRKYPGDWLNADASAVLQSVNTFYFRDAAAAPPTLDAPVRNRVWDTIREAFHFQNLSVEALAYVYENTFIDLETRRAYSTHATPYELAEYMVRALPIESLVPEDRTVFEPFAGAAPFLVAALGRLRELLPEGMTAEQRHAYFVRMLTGMELDPFACEIALYSLILADYPNSNGWSILEQDVFAPAGGGDNSARANVVLCNPPYGLFNERERQSYAPGSPHKSVEALTRVLQNPPKMLGFVLPLAYQNGRSYRILREKIHSLYGNVDVVKLPDSVFQHSSVETVLLLAYGEAQDTPRHRFATLSKAAYRSFRHTRAIEWEQGPLKQLWQELKSAAELSSVATVHRGLRYSKGFDVNDPTFVSDSEKSGFVLGLPGVEPEFRPYSVGRSRYLTTDKIEVGADWAWEAPKVIVSAARKSRGQWVAVAAPDYDELVCTQNFHCVWPKSSELPLEVLAAVINGPIANAWIAHQSGKRHSQVRFYANIPLPVLSPTATELITRYVDRYIRLQGTDGALNILLKIDAVVLDAYGLSEGAESELLAWFDGARRPGVPGFTGYGSDYEQARAEYQQEMAHFQQVESYQNLVDKAFSEELTAQEAQEKERLSREIDHFNAPFYARAVQEVSHGR